MANLAKIKVLASEKGISMESLAAKVDLTPQALSKLIKLNSTKIETLERISHELGVPCSVFFDDAPGASIAQSGVVVGGNNSPSIGSSDSEVVLGMLSEISAQRRVTETAQAQINELIALLKK